MAICIQSSDPCWIMAHFSIGLLCESLHWTLENIQFKPCKSWGNGVLYFIIVNTRLRRSEVGGCLLSPPSRWRNYQALSMHTQFITLSCRTCTYPVKLIVQIHWATTRQHWTPNQCTLAPRLRPTTLDFAVGFSPIHWGVKSAFFSYFILD